MRTTATRFAFGQARACVIERFIKSVRAASSRFLQAAKVLQGRGWINHGRERGGIGRDDNILAETPLEPQSGHAKTGVLIIEVEVARIVRGLRHSPGYAALRAIFNLTAHNQFVRLAQQASFRGTHHQRGHQVFKHRARPGDQRGSAIHGRERAAQVKPVRRRGFAFRDGNKACQARFRGEQVIAIGIQASVRHAITDREELARIVKQKS